MLNNKKIVIIGGSSGIGLETARQAIELGAEVIIASRSEVKLQEAKEQLGTNAIAHVLDTTDEEQVKLFFEKVESLASSIPLRGVKCRRMPGINCMLRWRASCR